MPKKKTWVKPATIVIDIGPCKYCKKDMINTESFVAFYGGEKAHYECMRLDDAKKAEDKTYE